MPDGVNVTGWTVDRGRSSELDKTQTGTASATMQDFSGALDPTNTGGPFYGDLDPMKPAAIALYNPVTETWGTVFTGFTSELLYEMDITADFTTVTMELVDAFDVFASLELTPQIHGDTPADGWQGGLLTGADFADVYFQGTPSNLPNEPDVAKHVDTRINDLLDAAGWPAGLRDIFSGNVEVQGKVVERRDSLLAELQNAADAEFPGVANIYVSKEGVVRFRGRFARFFPGRPGYGINTWKAGFTAQLGDTDVAPIAGFGFRRSEADINNATLATPLGVDDADTPALVTKDDTSIGIYGYRGLSFDSLLTNAGHDDDNNPTTALEETKKFSNYYTANYKDPKTRVTRMMFRPLDPSHPNAGALWGLMCGVELGDLISLETTHPGGGGFDEDFYVEGIHYDADVQGGAAFTNVTLELDVSPRSFFDNNTFGDFDDT
jgi:hypothetical protein